MTFTPRTWERNGTSITLQHVPHRISVALTTAEGPPDDRTIDILGWLTDTDADTFAAILDVMLNTTVATYGDGIYG